MTCDDILNQIDGFCVIYISSDACASCSQTKYTLNKVCNNLDISLIEYELNSNLKDFIDKFDIKHVPQIMLFYNKELLAKINGYQPEEILSLYLETKKQERMRD